VIGESIEVFFDGHCPICRREMGWKFDPSN
jgi:predicted DCC family thiol-disulfide oxidoreductase YuxK